jgi:hypothetical protein
MRATVGTLVDAEPDELYSETGPDAPPDGRLRRWGPAWDESSLQWASRGFSAQLEVTHAANWTATLDPASIARRSVSNALRSSSAVAADCTHDYGAAQDDSTCVAPEYCAQRSRAQRQRRA